MSSTATELAKAIQQTHQAREASWDGRSYALTYAQAADRAGVSAAIREPVIAALASGYTDFTDWADSTLKS